MKKNHRLIKPLPKRDQPQPEMDQENQTFVYQITGRDDDGREQLIDIEIIIELDEDMVQ